MKKFLAQCSWLVIVAGLLLGNLAAAQRRVFTNEDVSSAPPATPAADPAANADAAAPPAAASQQEAKPADMPSTPMADLTRVKAIQATVQSLYDEIVARADDAPNPVLKKRWTDMYQLLGEVYRVNQLTIEELQEQLGIKTSEEAAAGSESEPPTPQPAVQEQTPPPSSPQQ